MVGKERKKIENFLVSIILPVYNGEKFLAQAIKSCLSQTYRNIELIIVDDCSTDNSFEIIKEFEKRDQRVVLIRNAENKKLPSSLNIGHRAAKGDHLTWTSDDNFFEPTAIETMLDKLQESGTDIISSNFNIIDEDGAFRRKFEFHKRSSLLLGNTVGACFLYRKEVFERNKGYDENLHTIEDYDFWLQASLHSKFRHIPEILYHYRSHPRSLSTGLKKEGSNAKKLFDSKLKISYFKFFNSVEDRLGSKYSVLFSRFHQHERIDVIAFLKGFMDFRRDMEKVSEEVSVLNLENLLYGIDLRLRANIYSYASNQNLKTLFCSLYFRPRILYAYDRRSGFKMILKCFR